MHHAEILSQAFPARISAVEALLESVTARAETAAAMRSAADELDRVGPMYGRATTAATYAAFAELLRTLAMLVEWRAAVLTAQVDADRHLRGAKERHRLWLAEYGAVQDAQALVQASGNIQGASAIDDVGTICLAIARTPLPLGVFADNSGLRALRRDGDYEGKRPEPLELAVAFLRFMIDGAPAAETHFLTPGEAHDLEVEVRVTRWPDHADALRLTPVTIEPRSTYEFPDFDFMKPTGEPPFCMTQRRRAVIRVPQGLQARPFEFKYAASFNPGTAEQPIAVVGQRTLRIEGIDIRQAALTGYADIDRKIVQIRDRIRADGFVYAQDLNNLLTVLTTLGSLAGRAIQDSLFKSTCSEAQFQIEVRNELRRVSTIATELEEHAHASGGITDLSFRGIRIELKFEPTSPLTIKDCAKFAEQAASYIVATGKRVGVLCVLDHSPKRSAPFPADEGIDILVVRCVQGAAVFLVTVLIQGNLRRPSDLSA